MDWTLEVIVVPVSDVDRARDFYRDKLGFKLDVDRQVTEDMRPADASRLRVLDRHR
jgi:catechol 2,3-dioxygenase-like lactoylglutathione lyase family enzyme